MGFKKAVKNDFGRNLTIYVGKTGTATTAIP